MNTKEHKQRLTGIDLFRGIAAFAVVILHADEGITIQSPTWSFLLQLSDFAVPFFLATSFYLTVGRLLNSDRPYQWQARFTRLLLPYFFWSLVYLCWRVFRYWINHQTEALPKVLQQLPALLLLGKAGFAFHLYFIPLLLVGTLVLFVIKPIFSLRSNSTLGVGSSLISISVSLILYQGYREFLTRIQAELLQSWLDYLLIIVGYGIRCLPYLAIAWGLHHPKFQRSLPQLNRSQTFFLLVLFLVIDAFDLPFLPDAIHELLKAYSALLLAIALSKQLQPNALIASVSACSFGIYLMHLFVLDLIWSVGKKLDWSSGQVPVLLLLTVACLGFLISWGTTQILMKRTPLARYL